MKHIRRDATQKWLGRMGGLSITGLLLIGSQVLAGAGAGDEETMQALMEKGEQVYTQTCVVCHQPTGMGLPGSFPPLVEGAEFEANPAITQPLEERGLYEDGKIVLGDPETHIDVVLNGIPGTRMFAVGQQMSDEDVAAVVTYIRNAWGNESGDMITPDQVEKLRQQ